MKNLFKPILTGLASLAMFTSCQKDILETVKPVKETKMDKITFYENKVTQEIDSINVDVDMTPLNGTYVPSDKKGYYLNFSFNAQDSTLIITKDANLFDPDLEQEFYRGKAIPTGYKGSLGKTAFTHP